MSLHPRERYEVLIGLEVHTYLITESKLFSPAPVRYGDEPNHNVHPIDLGLPGVLPVLNGAVVELAIRLGLAIHGTVNPRSVFARKNYFYPDLPKGYQISQYAEPTVSEGWLEIEVPVRGGELERKRIGITRAHLEEDAGKSIHGSALAGSEGTLVDLNRAGVPLLEIVSEPDLRSAVEAVAYLKKLRSILRYVGVSDADMEKGQFRCDANVSLRPTGSEELGTRTETKNMNSFAMVEEAIEAEIARQTEILDDGGDVVQATMAYDPAKRRTRVLRLKENADDYRYFDDPDLIPLIITDEQRERVRAAMPELPDAMRARFEDEYALSHHDAELLTASGTTGAFYDEEAKRSDYPKTVANWVLRDVLALANERGVEVDALGIEPGALAANVALVESGRITAKSAREIFHVLVDEGGTPEEIMKARGLEAVQDTAIIEGAVDEVLAANPKSIATFREGDKKVLNFLMGQVMKRTQGKANPAQVKQLLEKKLGG